MHFGLGPIGVAVVKQIAGRPGFRIVGASTSIPPKSAAISATSPGCRTVSALKVVADAATR